MEPSSVEAAAEEAARLRRRRERAAAEVASMIFNKVEGVVAVSLFSWVRDRWMRLDWLLLFYVGGILFKASGSSSPAPPMADDGQASLMITDGAHERWTC